MFLLCLLLAVAGPRLSAAVEDCDLGQRSPEAATATPAHRGEGGRPLCHLSHSNLPLETPLAQLLAG